MRVLIRSKFGNGAGSGNEAEKNMGRLKRRKAEYRPIAKIDHQVVPKEARRPKREKGQSLPGGPSMGRRAARLDDGAKDMKPAEISVGFCFSGGFSARFNMIDLLHGKSFRPLGERVLPRKRNVHF